MSKAKRTGPPPGFGSDPINQQLRERDSPEYAEERMLREVSEYLESKGWKALVASADRIQGPIGGRHNYELVIRFTAIRAAKATGEGGKKGL